jgi:hypothetical protein
VSTSDWDYLIPRYETSPWAVPERSAYFTDLDWPTVGVYCPHEPVPWLLGSFQVSAEVLQAEGTAYWGWVPDYVTGDGRVIRLKRQSESSHTQWLVGDETYDRKTLQDALTGALEKSGPGPEALAISEQMDHAAANLRGRAILECGECGNRKVYRTEGVQSAAALLWEHGRREIALDELDKVVRTLRRVGDAT